MSKRLSQDDLNLLTSKRGYAIQSSLGGPQKSSLGDWSVTTEVRDSRSDADAERGIGRQPVRAERDAINYSGQCTLRIKVFRRRLCDPDNHFIKFHIDFLRYIGALQEDNAREVRIIFEGQEKVEKPEEERLEIVVEYQSVDFDNLWTKVRA